MVSLRAHAVSAAISETATSGHSPPRSDKKKNYDTVSKSGMAFIIEEAGGMATDGKQDLMSIKVEEINQRCPIYIGSRFEVEKAREFQV